ncbi:hypothetical protein FNYG_14579 [Fusarium nygamai]|uniref:NACHT-NTPase and P-loop NTPases N-terminal domain-containing protein n=1 Tax=Gibberella nygamai TaxID=42673 RepID=A0A2K0USE0_GIBNY|nr:hypothetical protein FNYG_14579 [Fusarium nygamai]
MSGAEIFGLISGTVSIIEAIRKLYSGLRDSENLPLAFREVLDRLPLVQDILQSAEYDVGNADEDSCRAIKKIVERCREKAKRLQTVFKEVAPSEGMSRFERYRMVVRRLGKGTQVEVLTKEMMEDVRLLVESHVVKAATETQITQLLKDIKDLSSMEPSVLDEESSITYNHYGHGGQNVLAGPGSQYVNSGNNSNQYNVTGSSQTINFGRD